MTNKEAISLLNAQINNLHGLSTGNLSHYVNNVKLLTYMIFPDGSKERAFIDDVNIDHINSGSPATQDHQVHRLRLQFADFLNKCIEAISKRKEPKLIKDNILSHKSDLGLIVTLTPIVIPLIVTAFYIGNHFGEQKIDKDAVFLKIENQQLRDSNSKLVESLKIIKLNNLKIK